MAKKKLGLEDLGGFVFSTNEDFVPEDDQKQGSGDIPASEQLLEAHYSSKGRAGKKVVVVKGMMGTDQEIADLGKELRKKCGVGGSVKDGEIVIQGDVREKVMDYLRDKGFRVKRVGG